LRISATAHSQFFPNKYNVQIIETFNQILYIADMDVQNFSDYILF